MPLKGLRRAMDQGRSGSSVLPGAGVLGAGREAATCYRQADILNRWINIFKLRRDVLGSILIELPQEDPGDSPRRRQ